MSATKKNEDLLEELLRFESQLSLLKQKVLRDPEYDPVLRFNICQMAGGWTQFTGHAALRVHGLSESEAGGPPNA